ncbi:MAG: rod shape-determining protein MreC [Bacillota bacterium]
MRLRFNKPVIIIVVAVLVVLILVLAAATGNQREDISGAENAAREVTNPMKGGVSSVMGKLSNIPKFFTDLNELTAENEELKTRIAELETEVSTLEAAKTENAYLKDMLNIYEEMKDWSPVATTVIGRSNKSWYKTITIKGGKNQGFAVNMPVITYEGLVGRISHVSSTSSDVILITDQECAVSAIVQPSQTPGVVEGMGGAGESLRMIHITSDSGIKNDQTVVTSGLGGIFPGGLRVGYIKEITPVQGNLMLQAEIKPFVDFNKLSNIMVLKNQAAGAIENNRVGTDDAGGSTGQKDNSNNNNNNNNEGALP